MGIQEQKAKALDMIKVQRKELPGFSRLAKELGDSKLAYEKLIRWKERTVRLLEGHVNPIEAQKLKEKGVAPVLRDDPLKRLSLEIDIYDVFLSVLVDSIKAHPEDILDVPVVAKEIPAVYVPKPTSTNHVFIIHGHDELNRHRLEKLLRKKWGLESIVMADEPGMGRTLIQKFEDEAQRAVFAFALMTPDDLVVGKKDDYVQARPNVSFELGWFYGRLGRKGVCILMKEGTQLHSDLKGISSIRFHDSIEEKVSEIENELIAAEILENKFSKE